MIPISKRGKLEWAALRPEHLTEKEKEFAAEYCLRFGIEQWPNGFVQGEMEFFEQGAEELYSHADVENSKQDRVSCAMDVIVCYYHHVYRHKLWR